MDPPPAEGNFCDDSNCPVKPHIVEQYNWHMGFVDISDCMANSYSMDRHNHKWTTKLFFHLLDLTVLQQLDSVIFMWGSIYPPRFQTPSSEEFDWRSWKKLRSPHPQFDWKTSVAAANIVRLVSRHNQQWPAKSMQVRCRVCSSRGQGKITVYKCVKCDVGLCVVPFFADYHTRVNL